MTKPFISIRAYVPAGVDALAVGLVAEVFKDRGDLGLPVFDVVFCTDVPGHVATDTTLSVGVDAPVSHLAEADLVLLLPGASARFEPSKPTIDAIRAAYAHGAIVGGHGTGCLTMAAAGLLDGRSAAIHQPLAALMAARYPAVDARPQVLYHDEGQLVTGAGAGVGLDLYLHLLRREHGAWVGSAIAREMLAPPHREGHQAQSFARACPPYAVDDHLAAVLSWAAANVHRVVPVEEMAARALMSVRTFNRRFKAVTGTTPKAWLMHQRLARAQEMLETTSMSIDEVARNIGYASGTVFREQFVKHRGMPPREYRRTFRRPWRHVGEVSDALRHRASASQKRD